APTPCRSDASVAKSPQPRYPNRQRKIPQPRPDQQVATRASLLQEGIVGRGAGWQPDRVPEGVAADGGDEARPEGVGDDVAGNSGDVVNSAQGAFEVRRGPQRTAPVGGAVRCPGTGRLQSLDDRVEG